MHVPRRDDEGYQEGFKRLDGLAKEYLEAREQGDQQSALLILLLVIQTLQEIYNLEQPEGLKAVAQLLLDKEEK